MNKRTSMPKRRINPITREDYTGKELKRGKKSWALTSNLYKETCKELGYSNDSLSKQFDWEEIEYEEVKEKRVTLDELYCCKVRNLSTEDLEEIIAMKDLGLIRRAPKTIQMIHDELANRVILNA